MHEPGGFVTKYSFAYIRTSGLNNVLYTFCTYNLKIALPQISRLNYMLLGKCDSLNSSCRAREASFKYEFQVTHGLVPRAPAIETDAVRLDLLNLAAKID